MLIVTNFVLPDGMRALNAPARMNKPGTVKDFAGPLEYNANHYLWKTEAKLINPDFAEGLHDGFRYKFFVYFRISNTPIIIFGIFDHMDPNLMSKMYK